MRFTASKLRGEGWDKLPRRRDPPRYLHSLTSANRYESFAGQKLIGTKARPALRARKHDSSRERLMLLFQRELDRSSSSIALFHLPLGLPQLQRQLNLGY